MPRASRYLSAGYTYHLTHRCHDRRFLLRFARDRDLYREWLRRGVKRYGVSIYDYCITSNHVHLIVKVEDVERVGLLMHLAAGAFAQQFNRRKGHEGSVWEHPYQCTIIQDGRHLLNALRYVALNMVRAGAVAHPSEWRWCGYEELMGKRSRYRLLDIERLLDSLAIQRLSDFQKLHREGIAEALKRNILKREAQWTESLAVGDQPFVRAVSGIYKRRSSFTYSQTSPGVGPRAWSVRETMTES